MAKKIDFSECRTILGKAYNGANGKKIGGGFCLTIRQMRR